MSLQELPPFGLAGKKKSFLTRLFSTSSHETDVQRHRPPEKKSPEAEVVGEPEVVVTDKKEDTPEGPAPGGGPHRTDFAAGEPWLCRAQQNCLAITIESFILRMIYYTIVCLVW